MKLLSVAIRFVATSLLVACSDGSTGIEPIDCPPTSTLTYQNFGKQLMETYCLDCHDRRRPQLNTQQEVQQASSSILQAAVYTDSMPDGRSMPQSAREQLNEWLACGAP